MKKQAMTLRALLLEDRSVTDSNFYSALKNIGPASSVKVFRNVAKCISHLNADSAPAHQLLFLDFCKNGGKCMETIRNLRNSVRYLDVSIVVYDSDASISIEETFVAGGNIYVQKASGIDELGKMLLKVVRTDFQLTYFLSV